MDRQIVLVDNTKKQIVPYRRNNFASQYYSVRINLEKIDAKWSDAAILISRIQNDNVNEYIHDFAYMTSELSITQIYLCYNDFTCTTMTISEFERCMQEIWPQTVVTSLLQIRTGTASPPQDKDVTYSYNALNDTYTIKHHWDMW